jgi:hypothetical protein
MNSQYERGQAALYVAMILPIEEAEANAVLDLARDLLPILAKNRKQYPDEDDPIDGQSD